MEKFKYEGREYRTVCTMGVLKRFRQLADYDISELAQKHDSVAPAIFLWAAIVTASKIDGTEFSVSLDDFCDRADIRDVNMWFASNFIAIPEEDKKK